MSILGGPDIITDGLVLAVDAANPRSYAGSGAMWYDVSGNGRDFRWSTTPTWNSAGYFSVNSNEATGSASNNLGIDNTTGYTIFVAYQVNIEAQGSPALFKVFGSSSAYASRGIFCHPGFYYNPSTIPISFDQGGCCNADQRLDAPAAAFPGSNKWTIMALTSTVSTRSIYLQGVRAANTTTAAANINLNVSNPMRLGPTDEGYSFVGYLAYFAMYNRGISLNEYLQNYNAIRSRFGL